MRTHHTLVEMYQHAGYSLLEVGGGGNGYCLIISMRWSTRQTNRLTGDGDDITFNAVTMAQAGMSETS